MKNNFISYLLENMKNTEKTLLIVKILRERLRKKMQTKLEKYIKNN